MLALGERNSEPKRGEIDASKIWRLAQNPRVKALNTYNANRHLEIEETFERILQFWVDQKLFGLKPPEAQDLLLEVLNDSLCSPKVIEIIKSKLSHQSEETFPRYC